ncbi:RHS repeat domain-containing protein [Lysobacter enzymogenes]|uniref:RHS repeat domain-containing protein n=1 Tax=Lysobacter enzymogenes TaxID=69 RepID=UPI001AF19EA1|nr:RHS repeat domain-containing protein [Lysobacter enzymogenes]QQQ02975.1 RHS repeat protein [Lysobacter enzymogenes]
MKYSNEAGIRLGDGGTRLGRAAGIALVASMALFSHTAAALETGQFVWDELGKRLQASQKVEPLGPNLAGDEVRLSNGALSFSVTDVSLPGNDKLPVALTRSFVVRDRKDVRNDGMLADWQIEAPNINGVFAPDWVAATPANAFKRCSVGEDPSVPSKYRVRDFWQGIQVDVPGGGELLSIAAGNTLPADGRNYVWMAGNQVYLSCLDSIKNGSGEGFLAIAADGTRYWLDWMAQNSEGVTKKTIGYTVEGPISSKLDRRRNALYATRVEDRFGNYVEYTYANAWNQPAKLTAIQASDGRRLTLSYTGDFVSSVSDGTRSWTYAVGGIGFKRSLVSVALPDGSGWQLGLGRLASAEIHYPEPQYESPPMNSEGFPVGEVILPTEIFRDCTEQYAGPYINGSAQPVQELTGTVQHPSGAVATFTVDLQRHGRSSVPLDCDGITSVGANPPYWGYGNDPTDDTPRYPIAAFDFTLKKKTISGPGLETATWNYSYEPNISFVRYPGTTDAYPVCPYGSITQCALPPCTSESCARASVTTVTGPNGEWRRYSYGNTFRYNEGKLVKEEVGSDSAHILQTIVKRYDLSLVPQAYPARYGRSTRFSEDGFQTEYHRPLVSTEINLQGASFSDRVDSFDYFARPLSVTKFSSLGYSRTETIDYYDDLAKWALGQVRTVTCAAPAACAGQVMLHKEFDGAKALPVRFYSFGALQQSLTYNADGTIASVSDGRDSAAVDTTALLTGWKRGYPQTIQYPDSTTKTASVDSRGWLTSTTDQNGYSTGYGYDAMGRVSSIAYPSGDTVTWTPKGAEFRALTGADSKPPGVLNGQWRESVVQGNYARQTYFDAMWRPVLTHEYDSNDKAATLRATSMAYDAQGRVVFQSYPSADAIPAASGTWTSYDVLGRITRTRQDSELGPLDTVREYLPGFQTKLTDPKGNATLTRYMAFGEPVFDWPVSIDQPEGVHTDIDRDVYGKPLKIVRSGAGQ